ncbi:MAG TPA: Clp protease N-terminal domain-containing protein [Acidimicrobiales bacterium]|nr:Clp protease N-terminal domain-containing protein [Acidimicrobiales bacterium]
MRQPGATNDPAGPEEGPKKFSRFTPRARASMAVAAKLAGKANPIDVRHILAGSIADDAGLAALALEGMGVTRSQLLELAGAGDVKCGREPGLDELAQLEFTEAGTAAMRACLKAALRFGHNYIGTEHLLTGVVTEPADLRAGFEQLGLTPEGAHSAIMNKIATMTENFGRKRR